MDPVEALNGLAMASLETCPIAGADDMLGSPQSMSAAPVKAVQVIRFGTSEAGRRIDGEGGVPMCGLIGRIGALEVPASGTEPLAKRFQAQSGSGRETRSD